MGYQLAVESMGENSPSIKESAFWLNSVLSTAWRVGSGGLEPRISLSIRETLAEALSQPYSKPNAVAHVALNAFTFGSSPPIVSRIELTGVDRDDSVIFFNVDVGFLLRDSVLLLGERSVMTNLYVSGLIFPYTACFVHSLSRYQAVHTRI